ncbi:hypothetical protein FZEAL_252 [Fusarium zealandicum]|uniref:GH16 domain-containing protein n=1 Tax=Fusarium zealandicum TaxID=1053134 RepID=A0A8H4UV81_9HYPO|nr:hypothetical protein FZEAL_252 [Fusarium zealandicum]
MQLTSYLSVAFMAMGLTVAAPQPSLMKRSPEPTLEDGKYVVDRATKFSNKAVYTFTGNTLPEGLYASNYPAGNTHTFTPSNVAVRNGYLELLVNGGQTKMPYKSGEIVTVIENIKYASVRTVAIFSEPAGVCNGMFFFKSDTQETDIEWLSDPKSQSNAGTRKLWLTNQDANGDGKSTSNPVTPPSNPTSTEHEYRIDWVAGMVQFFVDGVKVWQTTKDVPSVPGPWVWNNWSNGDKGWSVGPPKKDAVFKIKKIEMYYNTV